MAMRRREAAEQISSTRRSLSRPALSASDAAAAPSPALELQGRVAADLERTGKWPRLATLGFIAGACGGFWTLVAWGVSRLPH